MFGHVSFTLLELHINPVMIRRAGMIAHFLMSKETEVTDQMTCHLTKRG